MKRKGEICLKKVLSVVLALLLLLSTPDQLSFAQTNESSHWAAAVIAKWKNLGLIEGNEDGSIKPNEYITRGELCVLIDRVLNLKTASSMQFPDVPQNAWYAESVAKSAAAGIVVGSNGKFYPESLITRQEVSVILYRAFQLEATNKDIFKQFNDAAKIASWSSEAVSALYENGYITGKGNRMFDPTANITRAEIITMINNIMGELKKVPSTYSEPINKNLTINTTNTNLKNMVISGNLYITQGTKGGKLELDNVTVNGNIIILGASELMLTKVSVLGTLNIKASVTLNLSESTVTNLVIARTGENSKVHLSENTTINTLYTYAKSTITGKVKVEKAYVYAHDLSIEQEPDLLVTNGYRVNVGGKVTTGPSTTAGTGSSGTGSSGTGSSGTGSSGTGSSGTGSSEGSTISGPSNPSDPETDGPSDPGTDGPSDPGTGGSSDPGTGGPSDPDTGGSSEPLKPVIKLVGDSNVKIYLTGNYVDLGATATDVEDEDITSGIVTTITNNVNDSKEFNNTVPATYTFHYNVTDKDGNSATEVTRTVIVLNAVCITDFGAKSIDEPGCEKFNSSPAIKDAIKYAKDNNVPTVDFGGKPGTYYAMSIGLASDVTYINTNKAQLKSVDGTPIWKVVLLGDNVQNVTLDGIIIDGNMLTSSNPDGVAGDDQAGVALIRFNRSKDIIVQNCYLHDNWYAGVILAATEHAHILNNEIKNTDCGVVTVHGASNYILIEGNEIYGTTNQMSEPISIYNDMSEGYSHDIVIRNNRCYDKNRSNGISVVNAYDVLIEGNEVSNCCAGVTVLYRENDIHLSYNITIRDNYFHNNLYHGILLAAKDSQIISNTISDECRLGMDINKANDLYSENIYIAHNTITNFNSLRTEENGNSSAGIQIRGGKKCTIEGNTFEDTRSESKMTYAIRILGAGCDENTITADNIIIGRIPSKYDIQISGGSKNIVMGTYKLLTDMLDTIIIKDSTGSPDEKDI